MNIKKSLGAFALIATAMTGVTATPVMAREYRNNGYYGDYGRAGYGYQNDRRDDRQYNQRNRNDRYNNNRNYQRCNNDGTTGTILGAVVGGLLGHEVAGRNARTEGAIIGAAVGALGGRAIDKSDSNCRRR